MAAALVDYAQSKSIQPKPEDVTETIVYHGEGIYAAINGRQIYIGNERIMARSSCHHHGKDLNYEVHFRDSELCSHILGTNNDEMNFIMSCVKLLLPTKKEMV